MLAWNRETCFTLRRRNIIKNEEANPFSRPVDDTLKATFMTSMTDIIYRNQQHYKSFVLKVCMEELMTVNIVMYFPKHYYLREAINEKLSELLTAGLLQHSIKKYADTKYFNMASKGTGPTKLNVTHLFGIFNIWLIGCAIAIIIFTIEIFISNVKRTLRVRQTDSIAPSTT